MSHFEAMRGEKRPHKRREYSETVQLCFCTHGTVSSFSHDCPTYLPFQATCAGLIMLSNKALHMKEGGQPLLGGLDVVVDRNHFGTQRQVSLPGKRDDSKHFPFYLRNMHP